MKMEMSMKQLSLMWVQWAKFLFDQWEEALLSICYVHNRVPSQWYFICVMKWECDQMLIILNCGGV